MAERQVYTHNPSQHTLVIGSHIVGGYADGSAVMIDLNADQVTLKVGVKGAGTRSISQDQSGKLTVTLWPGSPSNDFLSDLADQDRRDSTGTAVMQFKDLSGNTVAHSEAAWVVKKPSADFQKEATSRVWVLETHNLEYVVGGERLV